MGWWEWDLPDGAIRWSTGHEQAHGGERAPLSYSEYLETIYFEDRARLDGLIRTAIAERGSYETEFRTVWPDGSIHWMYGVGRVFCDESGTPHRLAGVARLIDEERAARNAAAAAERRFQRLANVAPVLLWVCGTDGDYTFVNESMLEFTGRDIAEELGDGWTEIVHPDDLEHCLGVRTTALSRRAEFELEYRMRSADGSYRWVLARGRPMFDDNVTFRGFVGGTVDIHERRTGEVERERLLAAEQRSRQALEAAHSRSSFLARLGGVLERSLQLEDTLAEVVALLREELADAVAIDITERDGRVPRRRGQASLPSAPDSPDGCPISRTVPLVARGHRVGSVVLGWTSTAHPSSATDARYIADIAQRLALWIDNALLYAEREMVADTLQASLLPPDLPTVPGVDVAARYLPADERTDVGGDFYDLFPAAGGGWVVAVGDVCGKGAEAATLTAMARYTLRAASQARSGGPSEDLALLNQQLLAEGTPDRFLTAVLAYVDPRPEGGLRVRLACAGHPAPIVLRAGGYAVPVEEHGPLLGVFEAPTWPEITVGLDPGDALVLATDGVTEADRTAPLEADALGAMLVCDLGGRVSSADAAASAVEDIARRRAAGRLRDDVAVFVLRATA